MSFWNRKVIDNETYWKGFEYLQEVAKSQDGEKALTATAIADNLGILRSNVSRELNKLYRMGKIMKISGRPVLYKIMMKISMIR